MTPENLLYTESHEWVRVETDASGAKIATVGISAFAVEQLTDLVYIELPEVGQAVEARAPFGVVESVKAVSDLVSPVDGQIVEVNTALAGHLDPLTKDPYGSGWIVRIKITDESGLSVLLDYAAYRKQCEQESADD